MTAQNFWHAAKAVLITTTYNKSLGSQRKTKALYSFSYGKKPVYICKVTPSEQRLKPSKAHEGARCSSWVTWHCRYWFYPTLLWWLSYVNPIFQKSVPTPSKPIISLFAKSEITSHLLSHICSYLLILDFPVLVLCSALCHFCYSPRSTYSFPGHNYLSVGTIEEDILPQEAAH